MLFERIYQLEIFTNSLIESRGIESYINFSELRCAFQIKRFQGFSSNTADIKVWNMGESSRNAISRFGDQIKLSAGYALDAGNIQIFKGETAFVSHRFTVPDLVTTFECRSGEGPICEKQLPFSYKAGAPIYGILEYIARACDLTIVANFNVPGGYFNKGFNTSGSVRFALDKVCEKLGISWNIYDDQLILLPLLQATNQKPVVISEETGLIGYPERFAYKSRWLPGQQYLPGYKIRTALLPTIDPGQSIRLISRLSSVNEEFFVLNVTHTGDTHGEIWQSEFEVVQPYPKVKK